MRTHVIAVWLTMGLVGVCGAQTKIAGLCDAARAEVDRAAEVRMSLMTAERELEVFRRAQQDHAHAQPPEALRDRRNELRAFVIRADQLRTMSWAPFDAKFADELKAWFGRAAEADAEKRISGCAATLAEAAVRLQLDRSGSERQVSTRGELTDSEINEAGIALAQAARQDEWRNKARMMLGYLQSQDLSKPMATPSKMDFVEMSARLRILSGQDAMGPVMASVAAKAELEAADLDDAKLNERIVSCVGQIAAIRAAESSSQSKAYKWKEERETTFATLVAEMGTRRIMKAQAATLHDGSVVAAAVSGRRPVGARQDLWYDTSYDLICNGQAYIVTFECACGRQAEQRGRPASLQEFPVEGTRLICQTDTMSGELLLRSPDTVISVRQRPPNGGPFEREPIDAKLAAEMLDAIFDLPAW